MNFQKIPPVDSAKQLLELAFRKAREKSGGKKLSGDWLGKIKTKEGIKLDVVKNVLTERLQKLHASFPDTRVLPGFYIRLMRLTLDYGELKRSLAGVEWLIKQISIQHRKYARVIGKSYEKEYAKRATREFYGRISSLVKQMGPQLLFMEECRRIMKGYPDIKEMFSVCIYGFPNVGKSTLLNQITGTKAKTASYAFTTVSINAGYADGVQYLDVPGTLARQEKMNAVELQADLVLQDVADAVIFVFDYSETCGFSMQRQEQLFRKVGKQRPVFVYVSKQDLLEKEQLKDFPHKHRPLSVILKEINKLRDLYEPEPEME